MIEPLEIPQQSINKTTLPRRDFLKGAAYLAALGQYSASVAAVGISDLDLIHPTKLLSEVTLDNKHKVKLILGFHDNPNATKIDREDFTRPIAGIFLDSSENWLNNNFSPVMNLTISQKFEEIQSKFPFLAEAFKLAKNESTPFIYGDAPFNQPDINASVQEQILNHEIAMLSSVIGSLGLSLDSFGKLSRRGFLKWAARLAGFGAIIPSAYFSSDSLLSAAGRLGATPNSDTQRDLAAILSDLIHPNNYIIVMRNIIWALKIKDLYNQGIFPDEQVVNILGGWNHRFVGFFLKHPDIAENYFKTFRYKEIIDRYWPDEKKEWVHKSLIYRYNGNSQYVEHPALQKLLN